MDEAMSEEYKNLSIDQLIEALERSGREPPLALIKVCLARRLELRGRLVEAFAEAIDDDWGDPDDVRWYRAVHFGRLLIAFRERAALPIFARIYSDTFSYESLIEWFEEYPAYYGPAAIDTFAGVVRQQDKQIQDEEWDYGRDMSIGVLEQIALQYPATRQEILTFLRAMIPDLGADGSLDWDEEELGIDEMWSSIVSTLAILRDADSADRALALFDADFIDETMLSRDEFLESFTAKRSPYAVHRFDILELYG
ncbi:MAG: hypothetical protein M9936_32515 [Caldilinea sp.]|nr:hypothetical protein [Caldilinea sp.]MCB0059581.1 hypothetical protein [Caldilineaceae bacterium]MCB0043053.1 hypothetical protein [Caldilinea sp.]MCB9113495.1 hypothetical protein [Caldilineaceae bacterium]MCB9118971.1 hypothetical protein [Caldilineaceae bacterium]